jgi:hypothetical protein
MQKFCLFKLQQIKILLKIRFLLSSGGRGGGGINLGLNNHFKTRAPLLKLIS